VLLSFGARLVCGLFRGLLGGLLSFSLLTCDFFDLSGALVDFAHNELLSVMGSLKQTHQLFVGLLAMGCGAECDPKFIRPPGRLAVKPGQ